MFSELPCIFILYGPVIKVRQYREEEVKYQPSYSCNADTSFFAVRKSPFGKLYDGRKVVYKISTCMEISVFALKCFLH